MGILIHLCSDCCCFEIFIMKIEYILHLLTFLHLAISEPFSGENCWEKCFRVANTPDEKYTAAFNELYRAGMEARKMKNYFNANGTTYFLDSSIYIVDEEDLGNNLYLFQRRIASIVNYMMGSSSNLNPAYIFQFTQDESWTCNDHTCLDRCKFDQILFNSLENIKMVPKNHNADNAEAVCELAYSVMKQETTLGAQSITLLKVQDNPFTIEAAEKLQKCMKNRCCSSDKSTTLQTAVTTNTFGPNSCIKTNHHFGRTYMNYENHPNLKN